MKQTIRQHKKAKKEVILSVQPVKTDEMVDKVLLERYFGKGLQNG